MQTVTQQADKIASIWAEHLEVAQTLSSLTPMVSSAVDMIYKSLAAGGCLFFMGNGGSAADAQHLAAELTGRFFLERRPFRALALHANTSSLTAIGNDYGFEHVFEREILAHGRQGDVAIAISTSGNSLNILRAIEAGRKNGISVIGLTGGTGGKMRTACDLCICIPSKTTPRIQEMHITIGHTICEILEERLAGG
jgi:D-sedoheptulose 7-phosphate isomerase